MTSQGLPPEARAILDAYRKNVAALTERAARELRDIPGIDDPGKLVARSVANATLAGDPERAQAMLDAIEVILGDANDTHGYRGPARGRTAAE